MMNRTISSATVYYNYPNWPVAPIPKRWSSFEDLHEEVERELQQCVLARDFRIPDREDG
jgi:hypothetical protein